jgi:hypothetical protein
MRTGILGCQIKAARTLACIDQRTLAAAAGVSYQTICRLEAYGPSPIPARDSTAARLLYALGARGVALIPGGCVWHPKALGEVEPSTASSTELFRTFADEA